MAEPLTHDEHRLLSTWMRILAALGWALLMFGIGFAIGVTE